MANTITPERLAAIQRRCDAAMAAMNANSPEVAQMDSGRRLRVAIMRIDTMAGSVADVPDLLAEVQRLRGLLREACELMEGHTVENECYQCKAYLRSSDVREIVEQR